MSLLGTRVPLRSMCGLSRLPPLSTLDPDNERPAELSSRTATPPRRVLVGVAVVHRLAVPRRARICQVELRSGLSSHVAVHRQPSTLDLVFDSAFESPASSRTGFSSLTPSCRRNSSSCHDR
ncbi:hypothetical protein M6B38_398895 [Iris pallida]|uniref:Uncharacterized protein n=1 Tax=Iris pallida TaxID=29817 RepID=A0AAX6FUD9_IRIPA|nr:hypothetical protein M6B38_398895 [Iris pallida]